MNREWLVNQHPTYLIAGFLLPLLAGFLVGGAVALATRAWGVGLVVGIAITIWAAVLYHEVRHDLG